MLWVNTLLTYGSDKSSEACAPDTRCHTGLQSFFYGATALSGPGTLLQEVASSHSDTLHSVGLMWTSEQSVAETSTGQHTTLTRHT